MKIRFLMCLVALFALVAASCGSDELVLDQATSSLDDTSANDDATDGEAAADDQDAMTDDAMADDEDAMTDDAMADEDAMTDDATADEDAMTDDAMADDENATADDEDTMTDDAMADDEGAAERIVSLSPTATEMLFAIGAGDQVVAVDSFSYFPEEAPVTDLSGFTPNIEAIAGFEPDIVISSSPIDGITAIGAENYVVPAAVDLDDIYAQIEQLGARTGNVGGAAELVLQMQTDIDAVLESMPAQESSLTYYHELDNTLYSVTSGTFIGYVYDLFGLENIADPADADGAAFGYPQLNEEFIITADPDLIFLADTLCCDQSAETAAARPGWDQMTAVQNGNIIELNDDIVSRWGPRIVDFIQAVGTAVNELETAPAS